MTVRDILSWSKRFLRRASAVHAEVDFDFRKAHGVTTTVTFDVLAGTLAMATMATLVVRQWQSDSFYTSGLSPISIVIQFPLRCLYTFAATGAWIIFVMLFLRYIRWPRWWALPYVLWILCPATWLLVQRVRKGVDVLMLVLLQSPIIIGSIRRSRIPVDSS